jgi:hypothetical protein
MYLGQHRLDVVSLYNRIDWEVYVMNTLKERRSKAKHIVALMDEIAYLDSIIEPQDCGHLITARNVLYDNATKLVEEIDNVEK